MSEPDDKWEAFEYGHVDLLITHFISSGGRCVSNLGTDDGALAERVAACLNACAGIPTDRLTNPKCKVFCLGGEWRRVVQTSIDDQAAKAKAKALPQEF